MKNFLVVNGPNLNFLGTRKPELYGTETLEQIMSELSEYAKQKGVTLNFAGSNHEGAIIDEIHKAFYTKADGIILNAGAYSHYSIAIRDAIEAVSVPTVEVHLTDIAKREEFRQKSVLSDVCVLTVCGHGKAGYFEAVDYLLSLTEDKNDNNA